MNIFGEPYKLDTDSDASKKYEPMLFLWGGAGSAAGNAFWAHKDVYYPNYMEYDTALNALNTNNTGLVKQSPGVGQWKIIQGAESPISDETIVLGIAKDGDKEIRGKVLTDSSTSFWEDISVPTGTPGTKTTLLNNQLKSTDYWSIDVKYESLSGQSLIVWSNGVAATASTSGISFTRGTGQSDNIWTQPEDVPPPPPETTGQTTIDWAGNKVRQVRLATNPKNDEILLIASNEANQKFAVVWSGSAWADANLLADGDGSNFFTNVNVAYEAQSGKGFAVFGDLSTAGQELRYASFDGAASNNKWGNTKTMNPSDVNPSAALTTASTVRWTRIASDRKSDRILVGVLTDDKKIWTAIWDGASSGTNVWESESVVIHTADAKYNDRPQFSVAFESLSQNAMIVYSVNDGATPHYVLYKVFDHTSSAWSTPEKLELGTASDHAVSIRLSSDLLSDELMLMVEDNSKRLFYSVWNGTDWTLNPTLSLDDDTDDNDKEPFLFLYDQNPIHTSAPSSAPSSGPSLLPSSMPSGRPSNTPSTNPTSAPSLTPSKSPSALPSTFPSLGPSSEPTAQPSDVPSSQPSGSPSSPPSSSPSSNPSSIPSVLPSSSPTHNPSAFPSDFPTQEPSVNPTAFPSAPPSDIPSLSPSKSPSLRPTGSPTKVSSIVESSL